MKILFTRYFGRKTVSGIREKMTAKTKAVNHKIMRRRRVSSQIIINWGSSSPKDSEFIINKQPALASAKYPARVHLDANGVSVPKTIGAGFVFEPNFFPVVGRPGRHHSGNDYHVFNTAEDMHNGVRCEYYSQIIPKKREFRLHIVFGKCLIMQEKIPGESVSPLDPWNWANGSTFETIKWSKYKNHKSALREASNAVYHLGLDWGAVDVIQGEDDKYYVLEVNTAPTLEDYAQTRYAKVFDEIVEYIQENGEKPEYLVYDRNLKTKTYWIKNNSKNF